MAYVIGHSTRLSPRCDRWRTYLVQLSASFLSVPCPMCRENNYCYLLQRKGIASAYHTQKRHAHFEGLLRACLLSTMCY